MGNELKTVGGAIATTGTSILASATLGQIDALNEAVEDSAEYTKKAFMKSHVRNVGETVGMGLGTLGVTVANGVTGGQIEGLNKVNKKMARYTVECGGRTGKAVYHEVDDITDAVPVVGHVKAGIQCIYNKETAKKTLNSANRTTVVMSSALAALPTGPGGMIAAGVGGGLAYDGIHSGITKKEQGLVSGIGKIVRGEGNVTKNVIDSTLGITMDGFTGFGAGQLFKGPGKIAKPGKTAKVVYGRMAKPIKKATRGAGKTPKYKGPGKTLGKTFEMNRARMVRQN